MSRQRQSVSLSSCLLVRQMWRGRAASLSARQKPEKQLPWSVPPRDAVLLILSPSQSRSSGEPKSLSVSSSSVHRARWKDWLIGGDSPPIEDVFALISPRLCAPLHHCVLLDPPKHLSVFPLAHPSVSHTHTHTQAMPCSHS